ERNNAACLLCELAAALHSLDRNACAVALLEAQFGLLSLMDGAADAHVIPENGVHILSKLLACRYSDRAGSLDLCRRAIPYLRGGAQRLGMSQSDRVRFVQHITNFRHQVRHTGFHWLAREHNETAKAALHRQV